MPYNHMYYRHRVAPRVGAWIETTRCSARQPSTASLPVWERGLKRCPRGCSCRVRLSLPVWERGLKHHEAGSRGRLPRSLPVWERGLKLY